MTKKDLRSGEKSGRSSPGKEVVDTIMVKAIHVILIAILIAGFCGGGHCDAFGGDGKPPLPQEAALTADAGPLDARALPDGTLRAGQAVSRYGTGAFGFPDRNRPARQTKGFHPLHGRGIQRHRAVSFPIFPRLLQRPFTARPSAVSGELFLFVLKLPPLKISRQ